jgi:uncharacterized membrane protein YfcA
VPAISAALIATVFGAGTVAGALGALLGIGGGVFLVPFLNVVVGLPVKVALATSLISVIATSSAVSAETAGRGLINLRLGMLLEVASAAGGFAGALTLERLDDRTVYLLFAVATALIAVAMIARVDRRNVILDPDVEPGALGGRFYDPESGRSIVYRTRRVPLALVTSFVAGNISGILGIGGGVLKVPVLIAWCGVPTRAAAATSALMIGVTAVASLPIQYANGFVVPPLAAAAVLGVMMGSRAGFIFSARAKARWLKILISCLLLMVSIVYFLKLL